MLLTFLSFITGHGRLNGLSVSTCDWVEPYHDLSFIQNMGVNGIYEDNCNCVVSVIKSKCTKSCTCFRLSVEHKKYGLLCSLSRVFLKLNTEQKNPKNCS